MQKIQHTYLHLELDKEFRARIRLKHDVSDYIHGPELDDWAWNNFKLQRKLIWCQA